MKNQKRLTLLVILLLLTISVGIFSLFLIVQNKRNITQKSNTPKSSNTIEKKDSSAFTTYVNSKYNFSFDYPTNWTLEEKNFENNRYKILSSVTLTPGKDRSEHINLTLTKQSVEEIKSYLEFYDAGYEASVKYTTGTWSQTFITKADITNYYFGKETGKSYVEIIPLLNDVRLQIRLNNLEWEDYKDEFDLIKGSFTNVNMKVE